LKEEALDRTMWRHRFGGGFGPVVRQNTEWMNEYYNTYHCVTIAYSIQYSNMLYSSLGAIGYTI